jgi:hypothetical protein
MQLAFYLQLLLILAAATMLACWCGWGLAYLALPDALRPYRGLLTPLLGYALVIVTGYWFARTISGLPVALAALLLVTSALNLLAWRHRNSIVGGSPRLIGTMREHLPLIVLLLVTLFVGLAPLLHYGHPAVIGAGWDIESALPTARYIERGPIAAIADAPPNPLRDLVHDPPRIGKTVGFAVWQGSIDLLTGVEAVLTFVPLLAWLRALGVLAVYVLFRATLGLRRGPALLGAAWTSAGALLLWITYFNFEKQLAAWPLIPLGLLLGVAAVEELARTTTDDRRPTTETASDPSSFVFRPSSVSHRLGIALLAAIGLAALPVAYYPALTLWVPLAGGLAAAILVGQALTHAPVAMSVGWGVRTITRLLGAALALMLTTALLSAPTILDYWHGFSYRYGEQLTTLGVFRYIPMTDILGLTPYAHGASDTPPAPPWALAALVALATLAVVGLVLPEIGNGALKIEDGAPASRPPLSLIGRRSSEMRLRWLGMILGVLAYLAWLRWWQQYPYAYMKGAAYAGFVFVGLAAAGWQAVAARIPRPARLLAAILPLLLFAPMIASQERIIAMHWAGPGLYPDDFPALLELRMRIPAGSTVTLADDSRTEGVVSGLAAYMLDHTTVWGHVKTGYTSSTAGEPDAIGEYALLPASQDPTLWGYRTPIWRGGSYALYQRPPGVLAHLRPETILVPGETLALAVGESRLALESAVFPGERPRQLELTVAALQDAAISLDGKPFAIPSGGAQVRVAALPTGREIELRNSGAAPILLRSLTLSEASGSDGDAIAPLRAALVTSARATATAQTITTTLETRLPDGGPLTLALDIWDSGRGLHYGWYGVEVGADEHLKTAILSLDLRSGAGQALGGDGAALPFGAQFEGLREGDYTARLQVSAGAAALAASDDLFSFHVGPDHSISAIQTGAVPMLMTTTNRPPRSLDMRVGDDVLLQGYAIDKTSARAGDTLVLTLWWQALAAPLDERSVLIHLLDDGAKVAQADGAPARGARPTSRWQVGDTVIDSHQIALPADLPPGEYMLVFGMYHWPSLERLALRSGETRQEDDVVHVPIIVTRR